MLKQLHLTWVYPCFLALIGVFIAGLVCLPWAPGFPVTAKMMAIPGLYIIKAPEDAIVEDVLVNQKDILHLGQTVIRLRYLRTLSQNTTEYENLKRFEMRLSRLNAILSKQMPFYKQYQALADKKLISVVEMLQKHNEMRRLLDEKSQLQADIINLQTNMGVNFKMPFQGQMAQQLVQNGQVVKAKQVLMVLRPFRQSYMLQVKVPLIYQKYIKINQLIKLNYIQNQKIKNYPIQARVKAIYPGILSQQHLGKKDYFFSLRADVVKMPDITGLQSLHHLPLEGYLIGARRPIYQWILDVVRGNT